MGLENWYYDCLRQWEIIMRSKGILYFQKDDENLGGTQDLKLPKAFK